jgi:hypothetical protein
VFSWFPKFCCFHVQLVPLHRGLVRAAQRFGQRAHRAPLPHVQPADQGGEVRINRSTCQAKPFYLLSETVLPVKRNHSTYQTVLPFKYTTFTATTRSSRSSSGARCGAGSCTTCATSRCATAASKEHISTQPLLYRKKEICNTSSEGARRRNGGGGGYRLRRCKYFWSSRKSCESFFGCFEKTCAPRAGLFHAAAATLL